MNKFLGIILAMFVFSCQSQGKQTIKPSKEPVKMTTEKGMETATFAGGCFWCTEAIFLELEGVKSVTSGYTGGTVANPSYEDVSSGSTGHAEATQIVFDPSKISYDKLLEVFFATHDPTTLNRQGADVGTQYRSEVFYHNDAQKKSAEDYIAQMTLEKTFNDPIFTKITPAQPFYNAEDYHQNYYNQNQNQSYCHYVITPKVDKARHLFQDLLKK